MIKFKRLLAALLTICLLLALSGCDSAKTVKYSIPKILSCDESGTVAENNSFSLEWDKLNCCVLLKNKNNNTVWSTTPYKAYSEGSSSSALNSVLSIEYYDLTDSSTQSDKSYTCVEEQTVKSKLIKNGILVTYYFSVAEVTIPVAFTLENEGMRITIKASDIKESGKTKLISVSMAPYLCSVENVQDKSAYLLIPTGSGALMYTDDEVSKTSRMYQGEVYGTDASRMLLDDVENEEAVFAPVFGAKTSDNRGLFAIIEDGAESARIDATAGSVRYGYSNVYPTFLVRGYDEIEQIIGSWRSDALALSESWSKSLTYSVCYYPLENEKSHYIGMAKFYKEYLKSKDYIVNENVKQEPYLINLLGGTQVKNFFLGIPYKTVTDLTSFNDAQEILEDISKETGVKPIALLSGYGESGVDIGKVAGGFDFSKKLGRKKDYTNLKDYCSKEKINLFTNFELNYFSKSGNGFTTNFDTAKSANSQSAAKYPLKTNIRMPNDDSNKVSLLKRNQLSNVIKKLLSFSDDYIDGIALGHLASVSYSDYSDESTYMKDGTEEQVKELINMVRNKNHKLLLESANSYGAGLADVVVDVALDNGGYTSFDETVPFYQAIFSGDVALYSTPINYSNDMNSALLKAVEFGVAPQFTVLKNHKEDLNNNAIEYFYRAEYDKQKEFIKSSVKNTNEYFNSISGSSIIWHSIENDVTKTVFDNGITVYVNYGDTKVKINGITVKPNDFAFTE